MLHREKLSHLKAATVAIGVLSKPTPSTHELETFGSGFFIQADGWVMTVNHVVRPCMRMVQFQMSKKIDVGLVVAQLRFYSDGKFKLTLIPMDSPVLVNLGFSGGLEATTNPADLDLAILRPKESTLRDVPFLKIRRTSPLTLYEEIAMCGYPSGKKSLSLSSELVKFRLSSIMQFGKIAGLMPFDAAEYPYGVQTDIVGTGGSSGSPIVGLEDGQVIAIAQEVLPAGVGGKAIFASKGNPSEAPMEGEISALSNIGLTFGISHNLLDGTAEGIRNEIEQGIPYSDVPKISLVRGGQWETGYQK